MAYPSYLIHFNPNHDTTNGQFTFGTASSVAKGVKSISDTTSQAADKFGKTKKMPRADLSKLSDQELRDILNREEMERRYDAYFNTPTEKKGAKYVKAIASGISIAAGTIGTVAGAAIGIMSLYDKLAAKEKAKGA